ncbi:hypothetical protein HHK36_021332 [Tetracentron sinense]|uniref:Homeobox protein knotted-1-like 3 n=1 Tax=Tetracentron sinense TaxID=13715 RepID=A0A835D7Q8_TETSI|nr:hypothetical protein HHK36_021332 [Tetracentron sinense]
MAFRNHLSHEMALQHFSEQHLGQNTAVLRSILPEQLGHSSSDGAGKDQKDIQRLLIETAGKSPQQQQTQQLGGGPTWLSNAILRQQNQYVDGSFLHLQTNSNSPNSAASNQWLPRPILQRNASDVAGAGDEVPVSSESMIAAAISQGSANLNANGDHRNSGDNQNQQNQGDNGGRLGLAESEDGGGGDGVGSWQNARYKADILAHPLYEQLLSAHVSCLRIATPVDQLPRIDAQLAKSQHVVAKYSVLGNQPLVGEDKELDQFMRSVVGVKGSISFTPELDECRQNLKRFGFLDYHYAQGASKIPDFMGKCSKYLSLLLIVDAFETHYVLLLCSFKEQLQQHVRVHAMEAVMACWEIEQSLQSLTVVHGIVDCNVTQLFLIKVEVNWTVFDEVEEMVLNPVAIIFELEPVENAFGAIAMHHARTAFVTCTSPGEGTGATMSDDEDDQADSDTNLYNGSLEGADTMGFGPLIPTESERSLMERVRQELKHELKNGYKEKIVDIREEILRKRRAGKLPGDTTSLLKAWWQSHSKWPYPTEEDKARLVQETGLQLKQINNWFINQRKRNWHSNPSSSTVLKSKRKRSNAGENSSERIM